MSFGEPGILDIIHDCFNALLEVNWEKKPCRGPCLHCQAPGHTPPCPGILDQLQHQSLVFHLPSAREDKVQFCALTVLFQSMSSGARINCISIEGRETAL